MSNQRNIEENPFLQKYTASYLNIVCYEGFCIISYTDSYQKLLLVVTSKFAIMLGFWHFLLDDVLEQGGCFNILLRFV